jgi:hypothetical protein
MGILLVLALIGAVSWYAWWFGHKLELEIATDPADWGSFGDYIGGLLNPLISLFAFYWLGSSVRLQIQQIEDSTETMKQTAGHQKTQAELALQSQELVTINLELTAVQNEIAYHQSLLVAWLEQSNIETAHEITVYTPDAHPMLLIDAIKVASAKIEGRRKLQNQLIEAAKAHRYR